MVARRFLWEVLISFLTNIPYFTTKPKKSTGKPSPIYFSCWMLIRTFLIAIACFKMKSTLPKEIDEPPLVPFSIMVILHLSNSSFKDAIANWMERSLQLESRRTWVCENVKETYGRDAEFMEDGRDEWIEAMKYAEGNGTRKRGGDVEHITQGWKTWPQLICCALTSRNVGVFQFMNRTGFTGTMRGSWVGLWCWYEKTDKDWGFRVGRG